MVLKSSNYDNLSYLVTKKASCLFSKLPGGQWLYVLSEGLGNEEKVPCLRALLPQPADSNQDLTVVSLWSYPLSYYSFSSTVIGVQGGRACGGGGGGLQPPRIF